jgi:subtilisin family serine protease
MHRYRAFRSIVPLTSCLALGGAILAGHACVSQPHDQGLSTSTTPLSVSPALDFVQTPGGHSYKLQGVMAGATESRYVVAKLNGAPTEAVRSALTLAGYRIMTYLPTNALLLERVGEAAQSLNAMMELDAVAGVAPYAKADRLSGELTSEFVAELATEQVPLLVHVMPGHESTDVVALLKERGVEVLGNGAASEWTRVTALVTKAQAAEVADALAGVSDVFFVERIHHLGFFNDKSAGTVQSGTQGKTAAVTPVWAKGLKGEGQILGIIDSGLDVDSCYFRDTDPAKLPKTNTYANGAYQTEVDASHRKVIAYDFLYSCDQWGTNAPGCEKPSQTNKWDDHGHGTHCSGNMAGDASGAAAHSGMAPAAKIVMQDGGFDGNECSAMPGIGCPVFDLVPVFKQSYAQGVRIHNNSYGDQEQVPVPTGSNYTARSQDVDRMMWENKDMLIVFAAGNSGTGNAEFSVYSPSTNKNGLSVGSTRKQGDAAASADQSISNFSSRGWSSDGRIKPDIMAPGCNTSVKNDMNVTSGNCVADGNDTGCGTSYAAPILVGAAALVRQYFTEGFYPSGAKNAADVLTPSAALMKGVLLNSATAITGKDNAGGAITPIPSNEQGWGQVQLVQSLVFTGGTKKLYVDDHKETFAAGATNKVTYTFKGVTAAAPLKITLTWTDFPGTPDTTKASPKIADETTWTAPRLVNNLDLTVATGSTTYLGNDFAMGVSKTGGKADIRNNVEQVLLATPTAGDYTITINPTNIAMAGQDFALVVTGQWASVDTGTTPPGDGGVNTGGNSGATTGASTGANTGASTGANTGANTGASTGATSGATSGGGVTGGTATTGGATGGSTSTTPDDDASVPGENTTGGGPKGPNNTTGGGANGFPNNGGTGGDDGGCSVSQGRSPNTGWLALTAMASVLGVAGVRRRRAGR